MAWVCLGQTRNDRLAGTVKLWAYIKYCHPGVTSPGVDWDAALAEAVPKALTTQPRAEFSAVLPKMLDALYDPATRSWRRAKFGSISADTMCDGRMGGSCREWG
jgi:hypothetical protein